MIQTTEGESYVHNSRTGTPRDNIKVNKIRFRALTGEGRIAGQKVLLLKPQTYMNLSGESIRLALEYYKVNPQELIVIYDDIDIQAGMIRIRKKGSAGTHNGMRNILYHIRTEDFPRIRVGIGSGRKEDMIDYVTGSVPKNEITLLKEAADKAACGAACIVEKGIEKAMNEYNIKSAGITPSP